MNKQTQRLQLMIAGALATVNVPLEPAHGIGMDGKTPVKSLEIGTSPGHPGVVFVKDSHGNSIATTADELFVATQRAGKSAGYQITAVKIE